MAKKRINKKIEINTGSAQAVQSTNSKVKIFLAVTSILCVSLVVGTIVIFSKSSSNAAETKGVISSEYVQLSSSNQIVSVTAKNGFSPSKVNAKADTPTILKVKTDRTYDCSNVINIPSLGISRSLPVSGITEIEIPPQSAGQTINATCSLGQYFLQVQFVEQA
jgi:plastocyanin domain-containing protein